MPSSVWSPEPFPVAEIFGPTIQGEGLSIGRRSLFVRFAGCDFKCPWCDTKESWDVSKAKLMPAMGIIEALDPLLGRCKHVVLTGGNPCMYDLWGLVVSLRDRGASIGVETQGSLFPEWLRLADEIVLSPKRGVSDLTTIEKIIQQTMGVSLKVVVFTEKDYQYAKQVRQAFPWTPFIIQVGSVDGKPFQMQELVERVARDREWGDVRVLPQLHKIVWGDRPGV
jgi:7-carboxy-7-deazaguanine synthase